MPRHFRMRRTPWFVTTTQSTLRHHTTRCISAQQNWKPSGECWCKGLPPAFPSFTVQFGHLSFHARFHQSSNDIALPSLSALFLTQCDTEAYADCQALAYHGASARHGRCSRQTLNLWMGLLVSCHEAAVWCVLKENDPPTMPPTSWPLTRRTSNQTPF